PREAVSTSLSAVEWQVLSAMPTEGSVAEVIAASGLSAFTVFDVLHRLVRRGLVQAVLEDAAIP
ncbi:MAG TPA: helix-turn-helix domain-containing protein, partial [Acidimicrobiales bacterium]